MGVELVTSDGEAIARSLQAPDAFAAIFDRHYGAVHRYLSRRVGSARADDLAAQTFAVAFEKRASFRADTPAARPWLLGIATNLMRNDRRTELRELEAVVRLGQESKRSVPAGIAGTDRGASLEDAALAAALAKLGADQRDVLLLHAWGELSDAEIAQALQIAPGTVRSRLSRARRTLRKELG
jgi:RNA polymerase sigma-70 factor (ECF subfamily)